MLTRKKKILFGLLVAIIIIMALFAITQKPQIISASVSPEVIVKGQNQEVTVTAVVRPLLFVPKSIRLTMAERGYEGRLKTKEDYVKFYSVFKRNPQNLGYLAQSGKDAQGNLIYTGKFNVRDDNPQTIRINLTHFGLTLASVRLAISTRHFTLPPDPGEAGKTTLEGMDSDHDGLRDDVQREIFFLSPQSENLRLALGQYAKAEQALESLPNLDKKKIADLLGQSMDGLQCMAALQDLNDQIIYTHYAIQTKLEDFIVNTPDRKKIKYGNYLQAGMQFTGLTDIKRCSFNPSDYAD